MILRRIKLSPYILLVPFTGVFSYSLLLILIRGLVALTFDPTDAPSNNILYYKTLGSVTFIIWLLIVASHLGLEIGTFFSSRVRGWSNLLIHFRYAPYAIWIFFVVGLLIFDTGMVGVSRYRLRNYVYSGQRSVDKPDPGMLHNDDRSGCGNGVSARHEYLYFDTASEGLKDSDPYVRSRSFLASQYTRDYLNGGNARFDLAVRENCSDESLVVRQTAEDFLRGRDSSCSKLLIGSPD